MFTRLWRRFRKPVAGRIDTALHGEPIMLTHNGEDFMRVTLTSTTADSRGFVTMEFEDPESIHRRTRYPFQ